MKPIPGSLEAKDQDCTCSGEKEWHELFQCFKYWIRDDCPVHRPIHFKDNKFFDKEEVGIKI